MSRATTSRRVWLGIKVMAKEIDLSKLSQKDAGLSAACNSLCTCKGERL